MEMGWTIGDYLGDKALVVRHECPTAKTPFDTRALAHAALAKLPKGRTKMSVFRCGYCEKYHFGHRRGSIL